MYTSMFVGFSRVMLRTMRRDAVYVANLDAVEGPWGLSKPLKPLKQLLEQLVKSGQVGRPMGSTFATRHRSSKIFVSIPGRLPVHGPRAWLDSLVDSQ